MTGVRGSRHKESGIDDMTLGTKIASLVWILSSVGCATNDDGGDDAAGGSSAGSATTATTSDDATATDVGETDSEESSAGGGTDTSGSTEEPVCDPSENYTCSGWCESLDDPNGCYSRCRPNSEAAIGQPDDECTDPDRPYCAQIGDSLGGDFSCNGCVYVCVHTPDINDCGGGLDSCTL
jgi:hypothetical protein